MHLWMIDNYDSFTYNLVQYFGELGVVVDVVRNDMVSVNDLLRDEHDGLIISPGPGRPEQSGISLDAVKRFGSLGIPLLGVCLGHQAIGMAFGARIGPARTLMHGKTSTVSHDGKGLYVGLPSSFEATRYHSLAVLRHSFPACLEITAESEDGEIMGMRHRKFPIEGVQFHPESIMTSVGKQLLDNFLTSCGKSR